MSMYVWSRRLTLTTALMPNGSRTISGCTKTSEKPVALDLVHLHLTSEQAVPYRAE